MSSLAVNHAVLAHVAGMPYAYTVYATLQCWPMWPACRMPTLLPSVCLYCLHCCSAGAVVLVSSGPRQAGMLQLTDVIKPTQP